MGSIRTCPDWRGWRHGPNSHLPGAVGGPHPAGRRGPGLQPVEKFAGLLRRIISAQLKVKLQSLVSRGSGLRDLAQRLSSASEQVQQVAVHGRQVQRDGLLNHGHGLFDGLRGLLELQQQAGEGGAVIHPDQAAVYGILDRALQGCAGVLQLAALHLHGGQPASGRR